MSDWSPVETPGGTWAVSWPRVRKIIAWYHKSELILANWKKVPEEVSLLESWVGKPVHSMQVNWGKVRSDAEANTLTELAVLKAGGYTSVAPDDEYMRWLVRDLSAKARKARKNKERIRKINEAIQRENSVAIETNVGRWGDAADGAKFVRDRSADIFIIGVAILTGGASVPVTIAARGGLGGAIKGSIKLQDTGNFGAAGITFTTEFVCSIVPVKVANKPVREIITIGVKGVGEGASALVSGDDFMKALEKAALKSGSEAVKSVVQNVGFKSWMRDKPVFVGAKLPVTGDVSRELAGRSIAKAAGVGSKMAASRAMADNRATAALRDSDERTRERVGQFLNRFTFFLGNARDQALLGLAIVPPEGYTDAQVKMMLQMAG